MIVAFVRGANVGGHRRFRPSVLAKQLSKFDVVSVGAAGTFVVRKPGSKAAFTAALRRKLPFEASVAVCDARDILQLETDDPFAGETARPDVTRFVSVLPRASRAAPALPIALPSEREWLVRISGASRQFVFGTYRRHMKTIGYLGQIDRLFGAPVTTRNWTTIVAIARILKADVTAAKRPSGARASLAARG